MTQVELIYNHITNRSFLFIDSKPVPKFGKVTKYLTMPFHEWYRIILPEIYREVNDTFELRLIARDFECELFKKANSNFNKCAGITYKTPLFNIGTIERLYKLEKAAYGLPSKSISIKIYSDAKNGELMAGDLRSYFSGVSLLTPNITLDSLDKLEECIAYEDEYELRCDARFVLLYHTDPDEVSVKGLSRMPGNTYILGTTPAYEEGWINNSVYYDRFNSGNVYEKLEEWLDYEVIPSVLRSFISELKPDPAQGDLCMLDQIEPMTFVRGIDSIDLGNSVQIVKYCYPNENIAPRVELTSSAPNAIAVWNDVMTGNSIGTSVISAYLPGNPAPIATFTMKCIRRNPIQRFELDSDGYIMTAEDTEELRFRYYPEDADNVNDIRCYSEDDTIVSVDVRNHSFTAVSEGSTRVVIEAGSVSTEFSVDVYPRLENIFFTPSNLELYPGDSASYSIGYYPENVLDANFAINYSGTGSVTIDEGKRQIVAVDPGEVIISATNSDGSVTGFLQILIKKPFDVTKVLLPVVMVAGIAIVIMVFRSLFG